jgi:hypothetical protein
MRLCRNREIVYDCHSESRLSGMKNLMISNESTIEILRLSPQNDIATQSLMGEDCSAKKSFLPTLDRLS